MTSVNKRTFRSTSSTEPSTVPKAVPLSPLSFLIQASSDSRAERPRILPSDSDLPGLRPAELTLLRRKQRQLAATCSSTFASYINTPHSLHALKSTLILAQHEAGTAVCIDGAGWLLTCSHCIGETPAEVQANKHKLLLDHTGLAVLAECRAWDPVRDLALLKVVAIEAAQPENGTIPVFSHVFLALTPPKMWTPIFCIGQPGADDLESETRRRTKYNLIEISGGKFRGMAKDADPHDNWNIGSLKHDAWTYWGHSGAPLLRADDGTLIGLHSSWDAETAMRHGVPLVAIRAFLEEQLKHYL